MLDGIILHIKTKPVLKNTKCKTLKLNFKLNLIQRNCKMNSFS